MTTPNRKRRLFDAGRTVFYACVVLMFCVSSASAQRWRWPDKAENLKVMPKDSDARQLRAAMVSFVNALGVRCNYCHVGENGQPLSTFDFISDKKKAKETARIMMRMTHAINNQHLTELNKEHLHEVKCITCHQGQEEPVTLEHVLSKALAEDGVDAAIAKYHELRERYYGGFTYDFREGPLNNIGYELLGKEDVAGATKIFQLNVEMNPKSANAYDSLGEVQMQAGDKEAAIVSYKKSLELNPDNRNAKQMLEKLAE